MSLRQPPGSLKLAKKDLIPTNAAYSPHKYSTQILNLCASNAGATRPKKVGQMSELVGQSKARDQIEWETWYLSRYPKTVEQATIAIEDMLQKIIESARRIHRDDIRLWVEDLLLHKTFYGIYIQGPLLKKVSEALGESSYRLATPKEEAAEIDGYIGRRAVQIKPDSYRQKGALPSKAKQPIIYYRQKGKDIEVDYSALL